MSEVLLALITLQQGGTFILKVFDMFTPFSKSLLYTLVTFFDTVCVVKPESSRIVNSERYIKCVGFQIKENHDKIIEDLFTYYSGMKVDKHNGPICFIPNDSLFNASIPEAITKIGNAQVKALKEIMDGIDDVLTNQSKKRKLF